MMDGKNIEAPAAHLGYAFRAFVESVRCARDFRYATASIIRLKRRSKNSMRMPRSRQRRAFGLRNEQYFRLEEYLRLKVLTGVPPES